MFTSLHAHRARLRLFLASLLGLIIFAIIVFPSRSRAKVQVPQTPNAKSKKTKRPFVPGLVLVRYKSDSIAENRLGATMLATKEGALLNVQIERFAGSDVVEGLRIARVAAEDTMKAIEALRQQPEVLYAEPDYILRADVTPNDPCFPNNTLPGCHSTGLYGMTKIDAPTAWNTTTGSSSIVVGVVDEGIDLNHEDLSANKFVNPAPGSLTGFAGDVNGYNFIDNSGTIFSGNPSEDHASHVAGIVGAVGNNSKGVAGVNWNVRLMSLKFLDDAGIGDTVNAIRAFDYAKKMRDLWVGDHSKGANLRVLNASFGGGGFTRSFLDTINALNASGVLVVAAAGNVDADTPEPNNELIPHYPASYDAPNVISVAATDASDALPSFSHYGASTVDLAAPGSQILSTVPSNPFNSMTPSNTYQVFSGTSMSTPHVAGAAALLWAQNPNLTVQKVKDLLLLNGDVAPQLVDKTLTGRRLNIGKSFQASAEIDNTPPGAVTNLHINSQNGRSINVGWTASGDDGGSAQAALYQLTFTDQATGNVYSLKGTVPVASGSSQSTTVLLPYRRTSGNITVHAFDNVGNEGTQTSISVTVPLAVGDPYVVSLGNPGGLSTNGSRINIDADDLYSDFLLPFNFPYFGSIYSSVTISTNGNLYFSTPPFQSDGTTAADFDSSTVDLTSYAMVAGLWDDLDLRDASRADAGVYVTCLPTANCLNTTTIIFRWQGVPCNSLPNGGCQGGAPVNFEIELRADGTVKSRYGSGNMNLKPVVGISAGERDAYVIASHSSEAPMNLTNAAEVTYVPRSLNPSTIQFSLAGYTVSESGTSVNITVNRSGDTSGAASVDFKTSDTDTFTVGCSDTVNNMGGAYARCDYATTVDTLTFAAGETSKTVAIPIINDSLAEVNETFSVGLSNATGASLGTPATATVTINDNDAVTGPNPIFTTTFFVRQQYLDFLSREPEAGEPWSNVLNNCSDVNNNPACDRLTVSASFFGSPEFQLKGYFVYRFYKLAFDRLPLYTEIVTDMRAVTGQTPAEVFQKKAVFSNAFVQRPEFTGLYGALTNTQYVATLMGRYNLSQITTPDPAAPDGANKVTLTTADLTNQLNAATLTRAQVLRAIADSDQVFSLEFNQAFVAMQYYGYLRRTPEAAGFNAWLSYLNTHPTDSRTMVNGFMNSVEYRLRFGP